MRSRVLVVPLALALGLSSTPVASAQQASPVTGLSGTVTSEGGQPLAGVCVDVFGNDGFASTRTGADGTYRVGELSPGEYFVAFNVCEQPLAGFASEFYDDVLGGGQRPTPVELGDTVTSGIDAVLMTGATLAGRVTADDGGRPLAGICVTAMSEASVSMGLARTDADGRYALTTLRGGDHQVVYTDCSAPFTFLGEAYDDVPLDNGSFPGPDGPERMPTLVTLADRGRQDGVDAALAEGGSVEGTVTALHTGKPVDNVCVALLPAETDEMSGPSGLGSTGYQPDGTLTPGQYVVPSVAPGSYVLGVNPQEFCGDDGYSAVYFGGQAGRDSAEVLTVRPGDALTGFDAVVAPRPSISTACQLFGPQDLPPFADVPDGNLHAEAIDCLASRNVASGRGDGTFGPADDVSREQVASFVARTLRGVGVELPARPADAFADDEGSVHELAIDQLAELGVVQGVAPGRVDPRGTMTRGQMASFLVRAYEAATGNELRVVRDVFTDDTGLAHERSTNQAAVAGLAVGRTTTTYRAGETVNREQMATFLARLLDRVQRDEPLPLFGPGVAADPAPSAALSALRAAEAGPLSARSR